MNKFFYSLILIAITFLSNAQTLTFSKKVTTLHLNKSTTVGLHSYYTDTIRISTSLINDTVMAFPYDHLRSSDALNTFNSNYFTTSNTPRRLFVVKGYPSLWMDFAFQNANPSVNTNSFYFERFIVYLKRDSTVRDTVTFYLQFAPTGFNSNLIKAKNPIHPNPALNEIILDKDIIHIRIIDNLGKEVFVCENLTSNKLDISFLVPGVYYVQSFTKQNIIREKLIKN